MKHQFTYYCFTISIFITFFLFSSCGSKRDIVYFQELNTFYLEDDVKYKTKIVPYDNLFITVTASNPEAVEEFNFSQLNRGSLTTATIDIFGYLVDQNGNINFPGLGEVHLAGLTKKDAIDLLQEKISIYLTIKPIVNIRFLNYKVSVLGEVNRPGVYTISDEKISIPQAIALAGDLTIYGERRNVQLRRIEDGEIKCYIIDLTSSELFYSPYYYLQQNDILYISPNKTKAGSSTYNQNLPLLVSLISVTITAIALFIRYK